LERIGPRQKKSKDGTALSLRPKGKRKEVKGNREARRLANGRRIVHTEGKKRSETKKRKSRTAMGLKTPVRKKPSRRNNAIHPTYRVTRLKNRWTRVHEKRFRGHIRYAEEGKRGGGCSPRARDAQ